MNNNGNNNNGNGNGKNGNTDKLEKLESRVNVQSFSRKPELEKYFSAIKDSQILEVLDITFDKKGNEVFNYNPFWYHPSSIQYFAKKGFFPYCYDAIHNKLLIAINKDFKFPRSIFVSDFSELDETQHTDVNLNDEEIILCFSNNLECYESQFYTLIPQNIKDKVKKDTDIEFKLFKQEIFSDLLSYVLNPNAINEYYNQKKIVDSKDRGLIVEDSDSVAAEILDSILMWAVLNRGTDVHIEYTGTQYRARVRIDGDLVEYPVPIKPSYYSALINVIRNRCEIDISEQFRPQDGQMQFNCNFVEAGKVSSFYDIRVSIIPEVEGRKNAVLRIQQKGEFKKLDELGFTPSVYKEIQSLCQEPHGLILVTGPTGCGKTTTLYSILNELNKIDVKILTAEDPVEIKMEGLTQVAINEKQGRTFPTVLRHFLRQDPDIILVGEIRDPETAKLAISAANTGHLVLTTLHTNDSISSIKRLASMENVDPADFAFALKGVMAQRLIKVYKKEIRDILALYPNGDAEKDERLSDLFKNNIIAAIDIGEKLNLAFGDGYFPIGKRFAYEANSNLFEGRTGITEFWKVGTKAQDLIFDKEFSTCELTRLAIEEDGMLPMAVTGLAKVLQGQTSLESLIKIVGIDSIRHSKEIIMDRFFHEM